MKTREQRIEELKTDIKEAKHILSLLVKEENILSVKKQIKEMEQELIKEQNNEK